MCDNIFLGKFEFNFQLTLLTSSFGNHYFRYHVVLKLFMKNKVILHPKSPKKGIQTHRAYIANALKTCYIEQQFHTVLKRKSCDVNFRCKCDILDYCQPYLGVKLLIVLNLTDSQNVSNIC